MSNDLEARYSKLSNLELATILQNEEDYQTEAILIAKAELEKRALSSSEIEQLHASILPRKNVKKDTLGFNLSNARTMKVSPDILDSAEENQSESVIPKRIIIVISILFGLYSLNYWLSNGMLIDAFIADFENSWLPFIAEFSPYLFLLPISLIFFVRKQKIGWILFSGFLTYGTISKGGTILFFLNFTLIDIPIIERLISRPSIFLLILTAVAFLSTLCIICTSRIRRYFGINYKTVISTISISAAIALYFIAPYLT